MIFSIMQPPLVDFPSHCQIEVGNLVTSQTQTQCKTSFGSPGITLNVLTIEITKSRTGRGWNESTFKFRAQESEASFPGNGRKREFLHTSDRWSMKCCSFKGFNFARTLFWYRPCLKYELPRAEKHLQPLKRQSETGRVKYGRADSWGSMINDVWRNERPAHMPEKGKEKQKADKPRAKGQLRMKTKQK